MMKRIFGILVCSVLLLTGCAKAEPEVKNLILMIGDGMGLAHVTMLEVERNYAPTAFERAEAVSFVGTRSANNRVTDSAAAGTALATGVKVNNATLGVTPDGTPLTTMMEMARDRGLGTGLVVTSHLQHATPAAFYANTQERGDYAEIHRQLLACGFDVLIGGGTRWLEPSHETELRDAGYAVARTMEEVESVEKGRIAAFLSEEYLPQATERGDYLPNATRKALTLLSQHEAGFLLMVEGSQLDGVSHAKDAVRVLAEMDDFERAVAVAMDFADTHPNTLVVVTADHETGGLALRSGKEDFTLSESGMEYRFASGSHTAVRVPAYFYGAGAHGFKPVLENTELAEQLMQVLGLK